VANGWTRWTLAGLILLLSAILVPGSMQGWDLDLADHYYDGFLDQPWPEGSRGWAEASDKWGRLPAVLLFVGAAVVWVGSLRRAAWRARRREAGALLLIIALGPGAAVHGLKAGWGRSRPRDVFHWKRPEPYRDWWEPAGQGGGVSFPSGHAAAGACLVAASLIALRRRPVRCVLVSLAATAVAGVVSWARVVDGAHFLSDVLWSWLIVFLVAGLVNSLLGRGGAARAPPAA
jgi:membrane-associated PAP2 superfamily phosphatase